VRNIVGLRQARDAAGGESPVFVFNYVMMDSNIHEAPLFVELARRLGGKTIDFRHVVPMDTYDIAQEMLERHPAKFNHYRRRIIAAAAACGMDIYIPPELDTPGGYDPSGDPAVFLDEFEALVPRGEPGPAPAASGRPQGAPDRPAEAEHCFCDRPFTEVMIREQRDVYPCAWYKERMGTLDEGAGLDAIFLGPGFQAVRRAMLDPAGAPGCRECPIKANRLPTQLLGSSSRVEPARQGMKT
jgi:MoaA/NifB/PqqE/SkfB family radical SAM enzyme